MFGASSELASVMEFGFYEIYHIRQCQNMTASGLYMDQRYGRQLMQQQRKQRLMDAEQEDQLMNTNQPAFYLTRKCTPEQQCTAMTPSRSR